MPKIIDFFRRNYSLIILIILVFLTRFFYFSKPPEIVFDEIYFGKFVINYFSGANFFDIHPPLGKLIIFFFAKIFGFHYLENQDSLILLSDPKNLFILRIAPAFFGVLLVPLVFKLTGILSNSKKAAGIASFLIIFDNAFLVYSRYIFMDIILVFFGILVLYLFFKSLNRKLQFIYFVFSALALGATISIKWTGLAIWGVIIAYLLWKTIRKQIRFKKFAVSFLIFTIIPFLFYLSVFALHFSLIKKVNQDNGFFTPQYLKTLENNNIAANIKPLSFWGKIKEINKTMFISNSKLSATHPYSSKWYQWPFSQKPIYLWQKQIDNKKTTNLWLFGNLIIWLPAFLFLILSTAFIFLKKFRQKMPPNFSWLIFAYFANLLPFIFIKRVVFLYHYFLAITFAIIILSIFLERIIILHPKYKIAVYLFLALVMIFFIIFSPLSYGFPELIKLYNFQLRIIL